MPITRKGHPAYDAPFIAIGILAGLLIGASFKAITYFALFYCVIMIVWDGISTYRSKRSA